MPFVATPLNLDGGFLALARQRKLAFQRDQDLLKIEHEELASKTSPIHPPLPNLRPRADSDSQSWPPEKRLMLDLDTWVARSQGLKQMPRSTLPISAQWAIQSLFPILRAGGPAVQSQVIDALHGLVIRLPLLSLEREPSNVLDNLHHLVLSAIKDHRDATDLQRLSKLATTSVVIALQRGSLAMLVETCGALIPLALSQSELKLSVLELLEELAGLAHDVCMDFLGFLPASRVISFTHEWCDEK